MLHIFALILVLLSFERLQVFASSVFGIANIPDAAHVLKRLSGLHHLVLVAFFFNMWEASLL